ncbi:MULTISPECIES: curli assembly chaperone CsgC [Enterobacter cloacae complex]|uniref:Curli assembly protein CsgC n=1 Tax=Enterobacter cloacae TaxID=550 RepID=A0A7H8UJ31_ENTCL|nr:MULTISPECIES: curli assembly chaperone CsgC [Enterobacter cloacae complex]MDE4083296.1 curli assembly chaperone CsgC [Enterobacter pasteurii]QKZ99619.1 curli assembly protein CsgC [Enterobacter cloacae]
MSTLILLAALSGPITFNTSRQDETIAIIPRVTLVDACRCRVDVLSVRQGPAGKSISRQKNTLFIPANQPIDLTRIRLNMGSGDAVKIIVTVTDGKSLHLSQQWTAPMSTL